MRRRDLRRRPPPQQASTALRLGRARPTRSVRLGERRAASEGRGLLGPRARSLGRADAALVAAAGRRASPCPCGPLRLPPPAAERAPAATERATSRRKGPGRRAFPSSPRWRAAPSRDQNDVSERRSTEPDCRRRRATSSAMIAPTRSAILSPKRHPSLPLGSPPPGLVSGRRGAAEASAASTWVRQRDSFKL